MSRLYPHPKVWSLALSLALSLSLSPAITLRASGAQCAEDGAPERALLEQSSQALEVASQARGCNLPTGESFRKALLCLEDDPETSGCLAGLNRDEKAAALAIFTEGLARRTENRLQSIFLKSLAGTSLDQKELKLLELLSSRTGRDLKSEIATRAIERRPLFLQSAKQLGARVDSDGVDLSRFDFKQVMDPGSAQSQFLEQAFGPSWVQSLREGNQALHIGKTVVLPDLTVMDAKKYSVALKDELDRFKAHLSDYAKNAQNYSSWGSSFRRVWDATLEGYGLQGASMDKDLTAANPGWTGALQSMRKLKFTYGMTKDQMIPLRNALEASVQDERAAIASGSSRVDKIFKAYFGTLGAAAVIATGGFAAGPVLGVSSTTAMTYATAGVATGVVITEGIGVFKAAVAARSLSDFACRLRDELMEGALDSLARAPLDAALGLVLPAGTTLLGKGHQAVFGMSAKAAQTAATTEVALAFAAPAVGSLPEYWEKTRELYKKADELEQGGDIEGAERLRAEARSLGAEGTGQTLAVAFPLLHQTLSGAQKKPSETRRFVNSKQDFRVHTESHISRVERLGLELKQSRASEFADVPDSLIRDFLKLHDQAKVDTDLSHSRPRPILDDLYQLYGKKLSPEEAQAARKIFQELNDIDAAIAMRFFKNRGLLDTDGKPNALAKKLLEIEKAADLADRGMNPVSPEEFGRAMDPASKFFETQIAKLRAEADSGKKDRAAVEREIESLQKSASLARTLETPGLYERSTRGQDFPTVRAAQEGWRQNFTWPALESALSQ